MSTIWRALDFSVWEYGSPLLKRSIYTQPVSVPGGIGAPDPGVRIQASTTSNMGATPDDGDAPEVLGRVFY